MGEAMRVIGGIALSVLASACGGSDDFVAPTCAPGELALDGTVDGEPVSVRIATGGVVWSNYVSDDETPYLDVRDAEGLEPIVHIEWDRGIARDHTTDAFGYVNVPSGSGTLHVGNCADDGFVSIITAREDGAEFLLRDLRAGPPCEGEAISGELTGCLAFSSR